MVHSKLVEIFVTNFMGRHIVGNILSRVDGSSMVCAYHLIFINCCDIITIGGSVYTHIIYINRTFYTFKIY